MKKSDKPSPFILVKANVQSEWDVCNCALVEIDDKATHLWKIWDKSATELGERHKGDVANLSMYENSAEYLNIELPEDIEEVLNTKGWCHVDIEGADVDDMEHPEQRTDCHMMKLYGDGSVCWVSYGKHTGEEFWTETININEL